MRCDQVLRDQVGVLVGGFGGQVRLLVFALAVIVFLRWVGGSGCRVATVTHEPCVCETHQALSARNSPEILFRLSFPAAFRRFCRGHVAVRTRPVSRRLRGGDRTTRRIARGTATVGVVSRHVGAMAERRACMTDEQTPLDPNRLTPEQAAKLLSAAAKVRIPVEQIARRPRSPVRRRMPTARSTWCTTPRGS